MLQAVVDVDFTGQELVDVFEGIVSGKNVETSAVSSLHVLRRCSS